MTKPAHTLLISGLGILMVAIQVRSQTPPAQKPSFAVASVKRSAMAAIGIRPAPDRFVANGMSLHNLIQFAYLPCAGGLLLDNQIVGAPGWVDADTFDIEAKPDAGQPVPPCQMQRMVQSLLEERFQLKAHFETRELPVFNLVVAKPGKMTLSPDQTSPGPPSTSRPPFDPSAPPPRGTWNIRSGLQNTTISGTAIPIGNLARALLGSSLELRDRPLTDKTDLKGLYDVHLQFTPQSPTAPLPADSSGPSIFTAIQEQLGLKVESTKGPVEVLVIDGVQRPTKN